MSLKFQFPGVAAGMRSLDDSTEQVLPSLKVAEYTVSDLRAAEPSAVEIEADEKDVFEFTMEDDSVWYLRADDLADRIRKRNRARGLPPSDADVLVIPTHFEQTGQTRGLLSDLIRQKLMRHLSNWASEKSAEWIARKIESRISQGLYKVSRDFTLEPAGFDGKPGAPAGAWLLLLHGTASSTVGSFKTLAADNNPVWDKICALYENRIIAFEHKTWTESPVLNAVHLIESLPDGITLDLISHSRGGLIGEILARFAEGAQFAQQEAKILGDIQDENLSSEMDRLHKLLGKKKIEVRNFVRVACPVAGTTLLSEKFDLWLNIIFNLVKLTPGIGEVPGIGFFADLIKAIVHQKSNPDTLPGLASMIPGSPLSHLLNHPELEAQSRLYLITGDAQSSKLFPAVLTFVGDTFFRAQHDLVVPVSSMRMGTKRSAKIMEHFSGEKSVDHFKYFLNPVSRNAILSALQPEAVGGSFFNALESAPSLTRKVSVPPPFRPDRPTVFLLPGIMGSHLRSENGRLWLNYARIVTGNLSKLQISSKDIVPDGVHDPSYAAFIDFLRDNKGYNVIPFAYDWRKDLTQTAEALAAEVETCMEKSSQTISFAAHSMGGVLLSAMFGKRRDLFDALKQREGFRALLMGVPLQGSYAIPRLLAGRDKILSILALMDIVNRKGKLLSFFVKFPGLLQLLPRNDERIGQLSFWKELRKAEPSIPPFTEKELEYLNSLKEIFPENLWDENIFKYIAGQDYQTPSDVRILPKNKVEFASTPEGDGRVPWATIPVQLSQATYYVGATHGDISDHRESFEGYAQLLQNGETELLSRKKPALRQILTADTMPDTDIVEYPSDEDLHNAVGGKRAPLPHGTSETEVRVTLTHGDMAHAMFPVMAGHFKGDAILYAEAALDRLLDKKLSMRYEMGHYPADVGENIVLLPKKGPSKGGIVIGLGNFGELTEAALSKSIRFALTNYLIQVSEEEETSEAGKEVGVSALLIGSGYGNLLIINTVKAIFNAVQEVNKRAAARPAAKLPRIGHVEIIEMYRHKAVQCYRLIRQLAGDPRYGAFRLRDDIKKAAGRKDGIPDEINTDWWQRIKISLASSNQDQATRPIVFTSITDRSRAEEKTLDTNRLIVDALVRKAARVSRFDLSLSRALFELLVPNEFKSYTSGLRHMVLIVDKETARYPWELMSSSTHEEAQPIAVKAGMLRQLSTSNFRLQAENVTKNTALVVGDPLLHGKYNQLPGAKEEAENVEKLLRDHGFEVRPRIQAESTDIVVDLLSEQYKILHFAAHGVSKDPGTGETGVVIGPDMILTPSIFKQIRPAPELVFVNCCSLGEIDKKLEEHLQAKFEVAASIGCQLIEMGVKAVILAGWEVEDQAAKRFSEVVYGSLLAGEAFGDAVLKARNVAYEYKDSNTWGAYQCYGDPFFRLTRARPSSQSGQATIADAEEAVTILENFFNGLDTSHGRTPDKAALIKKAEDMERNIPARFTHDARVLERIAEAYSKAGDLNTAIDRYQRLLSFETAVFSYRAVEQLQNLRIRHLQESFDRTKREDPVQVEVARATIEDCTKELKRLNTPQPTSERLSMIAGTYKRAFMILEDFDYFNQMERAYFESYRFNLEHPAENFFYPFFNWVIARALWELKGETPDTPAPSEEEIKAALDNAATLDGNKPDFWNKTAPSMAYIYRLLISKEEKEISLQSKSLVENFRDAWKIEGNENNRKSHLDQFDLVLGVLKKVPADSAVEKRQKALESAKKAISAI